MRCASPARRVCSSRADLLYQWAKIGFLTHHQGHPVSLVWEAHTIYERIGDATGVFDASLDLVDFIPPPEAITEILKLHDGGVASADSKGLAACQFKLAKAYSSAQGAPQTLSSGTISPLLSASDVDCRTMAMNLQYLVYVFPEIGNFSAALQKLEGSLFYAKRANDESF
ncbi:hypothetical protein AURDEDRAFT_175036 [Auricularia subglabra TFB-10046 SS5]|nr:hypothetical protein AURDEDRAFT_175036 [Auricularia subglabra TFB-10046 SS5]